MTSGVRRPMWGNRRRSKPCACPPLSPISVKRAISIGRNNPVWRSIPPSGKEKTCPMATGFWPGDGGQGSITPWSFRRGAKGREWGRVSTARRNRTPALGAPALAEGNRGEWKIKQHPQTAGALPLAGPTGFEPAVSGLTGRCVKPGYTTAPNGGYHTTIRCFRQA